MYTFIQKKTLMVLTFIKATKIAFKLHRKGVSKKIIQDLTMKAVILWLGEVYINKPWYLNDKMIKELEETVLQPKLGMLLA